MGLGPRISNSSYDSEYHPYDKECNYKHRPTPVPIATSKQSFGNPNPLNFNIIRTSQIKNYLLVEVAYPDCYNYEGIKLLVYKDCTVGDIIKQGSMDPHFSENKTLHSPIARFVPTNEGWSMAESFVYLMSLKE